MSGHDGKYRWWIGRGRDAESWGGPYDSRDEAIQVGKTEMHADGDGFTVYEADKSVALPHFNTDSIVESIVESVGENNEECWSEDGFDEAWSDADRSALGSAIEKAVADWMEKHPAKTWAAGNIRVEEYFGAEAAPRPRHDLSRHQHHQLLRLRTGQASRCDRGWNVMTIATSGDSQFKIRMPGELRDRIHEVAAQNSRSANSEILATLSREYGAVAEGETAMKSSTITVRITTETRDKLDRLSARGPYRISITSIIERGIELAALELERLK